MILEFKLSTDLNERYDYMKVALLTSCLLVIPLINTQIFHDSFDIIPNNSTITCPQTIKFEKHVRIECYNYPSPYMSIKLTNLYINTINYENSDNITVKVVANPPNDSLLITYQNPLDPKFANKLIGIALDGIPIYSSLQSNGGNVFENSIGIGSYFRVDHCGGTYGPTSDGVRYHYRVMPSCILNKLNNNTRRLLYVNEISELLDYFTDYRGPYLLGYTLKGYPIYSPYDENGNLQTHLDNCHGKYLNGLYGYYVSTIYPYIWSCDGPGVYSSTDVKSSSKSSVCPKGYYKSFGGLYTGCIPCPAGKYTSHIYDSSTKYPCIYQPDKGYYSLQGSTGQTKCPSGRYGGIVGLNSSDCSGPCQQGYFCTLGSVSSTQFECGNYSYYCPVGSSKRTLVSKGYYSTPENVSTTTRFNQSICEPGFWCHKGKRFPCPVGRYGNTYGLTNNNCTSECLIGHYCPEGSSSPIKCPSGTYSNTTSAFTSACDGLCNKGYYCLEGSTSSTMYKCRGGIAGETYGLKTPSCSADCEKTSQFNDTNIFCIINYCQSGYYCPETSISTTQNECGSPSLYCPKGSVYPSEVSIGYYTIGFSSLPLQLQSNDDATTRFGQVLCEPGYYCINGIKRKCPKSYFGSDYGLNSSYCNGLCDEGYICDEGSTSPTQSPCGTGPNVYCPKGSYEPTVVPPGYYSINGTLTTRSAILSCPKGMWCQNGENVFCIKGRYSSYGSNSSNCDGLCPSGYYCPQGSISPIPCPAGRYGLEGQGDSSCSGSCYEGYYCPENSTTPYAVPCGSEYHYCPRGSAYPQKVSLYHYSVGGTATTRTGQNLCDFSRNFGSPPDGEYRINVCPSNTLFQ